MNERKEHPIIFKPEMVKAILQGRKTQTRRIISERNSSCTAYLSELDFNDVVVDGKKYDVGYLKVARPEDETRHRVFPKWDAGDWLYVRHNWFPAAINGNRVLIGLDPQDGDFSYEIATDNIDFYWKQMNKGHMIPAIHLPKEACGIWLELKSIRPEKIQEISNEDAIAEGIEFDEQNNGWKDYRSGYSGSVWKKEFPIESFKTLWDSINENWEKNDWVWRNEFFLLSTIGKPKVEECDATAAPQRTKRLTKIKKIKHEKD